MLRSIPVFCLFLSITMALPAQTLTPEEMLGKIRWISIAGFQIESDGKTVYFDPVNIKSAGKPKADVILITHAHSDHFNLNDINKITNSGTVIVAPNDIALWAKRTYNVVEAVPGMKTNINGIGVEVTWAYNKLHPREPRSSVGYVVTLDGVRIYHTGPSDIIPETSDVRTDIILNYMHGTTGDDLFIAHFARAVGAKYSVPMHIYPGNIDRGEIEKQNRSLNGKAKIVVLPLDND